MRVRLIRSTLLLAAAAAALLLAGCTDEGGTPTATNTGQPSTPATLPSSPTQGDGLAGLVACELLTAAEVKQFGVTEPGDDRGSLGGTGTSSCRWQRPSTANMSGVTFGLAIRPAQSIESVVAEEGWTKESGNFEGRKAVNIWEQRETSASCTLALAVGESARVDVNANGVGKTEEICDVVNKIATIVEPKLPKDGG